MALLSIRFSEEKRRNLATFIAITHWMCILPSFTCFVLVLYIYIHISDNISFVEDYNDTNLPVYLLLSALFGLFCHILCGKVAFSNRIPEKRKKWMKFLLPAVIATAVLFLFEIITGILCILHIAGMKDSFSAGIKHAMNAYKDDATIKTEVDMLQIENECCGIHSYTDWFHIAWIHPDYLNPRKSHSRMNSDEIMIDDVPFSCCNPQVLRPCINHHVHDNDLHFNYDYHEGTTLYKHGCTDKLMILYKDHMIKPTAALILFLSYIQFILTISLRFLQRSITSANKESDTSTKNQFIPPKEVSELPEDKHTLDATASVNATLSKHVGTNTETDKFKDPGFDENNNVEIEEKVSLNRRIPMHDIVKSNMDMKNVFQETPRLHKYHSLSSFDKDSTMNIQNSLSMPGVHNVMLADVMENGYTQRQSPSISSLQVLAQRNSRVYTLAKTLGPIMMRSFSKYSETDLLRQIHEKKSHEK